MIIASFLKNVNKKESRDFEIISDSTYKEDYYIIISDLFKEFHESSAGLNIKPVSLFSFTISTTFDVQYPPTQISDPSIPVALHLA